MSTSAVIERRKVHALSVVVTVAMFLAWPGAVGAQGSEPDDPLRTVTVSGVGRMEVEPDEAVVRVGVTTRGNSAKATNRRAASRMSSVLSALRGLGIDDADLKTTRVEMRPYRRRNKETDEVLSGWVVSNQVKVTVHDSEDTGDVIDAAGAAGANDIDGVRFRASDPSAAVSEARAAAVVAAETAANELAGAAGIEVLGVLSIVEGDLGSASIAQRGPWLAENAVRLGTPIEPGTIDITVSVTAVYEVG